MRDPYNFGITQQSLSGDQTSQSWPLFMLTCSVAHGNRIYIGTYSTFKNLSVVSLPIPLMISIKLRKRLGYQQVKQRPSCTLLLSNYVYILFERLKVLNESTQFIFF